MTKNRITESDLVFRKVKLKEQYEFYRNAMESVDEFATSSLGFSWNTFKKVLLLNRLTGGLVGKIFMKNINDYIVVFEDKMVAGYSIASSDERDELGNVFTIPSYQGRGIASIMLKKILSDHSDKPIRLDVNTKNEIAIHIYSKNGFVEIGRTKEYIIKTPIISKPFDVNFSARRFQKEDVKNLADLKEEVPNLDVITKAYSKSLRKTKKNSRRIETHVPFVLLENDTIVGLARAIWSKMTPGTASILASVIKNDAKENYAPFLSYISEELIDYGIKKVVWNLTEKTRPFEDYIKPYIGDPIRESIIMEKNSTKPQIEVS